MVSNHKLSHNKEIDPESAGYEYFSLQIDDQNPFQVTRHQLVKLLSGNNVTISAEGRNITFNATVQQGDSYIHPQKTWEDKSALSGAQVISNLTINSLGHPTGWTIRSISLSDIGAAAENHSHDFDKYLRWRLQIGGSVVNNIEANDLVKFISSESNDILIENGSIVVKRKNKVVVNVPGSTVGTVTNYNHRWMNITTANAIYNVSGTYAKDDEIEGSFEGTGRLTINGQGITLVYPEEFHQNKIPSGGAFALKFLTPTKAVLFGRLIPVGI